MEDMIREKLVPTLIDRPPPNDVERHLFSLPARLGGLAIPNPCDTSDGTYDASEKISTPLKQAILTQEFQYTVVSRKYAPPICNLSLSTKRRGGLYAGCDIFSRDYAPPPLDREMSSGSVDADFVLALHSTTET